MNTPIRPSTERREAVERHHGHLLPAFMMTCWEPTAADVRAWSADYPEHADKMFESAKTLMELALFRGRGPLAVPTE